VPFARGQLQPSGGREIQPLQYSAVARSTGERSKTRLHGNGERCERRLFGCAFECRERVFLTTHVCVGECDADDRCTVVHCSLPCIDASASHLPDDVDRKRVVPHAVGEEPDEKPSRQRLQLDRYVIAMQFERPGIEMERSESVYAGLLRHFEVASARVPRYFVTLDPPLSCHNLR